jgi:transcriptional regulator with XRE-family HTH domain
MEPKNMLGSVLRATRKEGAFGTMDQFSALLGVSKNTLATYERGERLPDIDFLATFASITGVDFNELLRLRLLDSQVPASRRLGELWTPPPGAGKVQDANQVAEQLADMLDELVEEAEIQFEGEDTYAFLDTDVRDDYINKIKRLIIYHEFKDHQQREEKPSTRYESPPVDPKLMTEIVSKLEIEFLTSDSSVLAFHRFINENRHLLRRLSEKLNTASEPSEIPLEDLINVISRHWVRYAGAEAGAAAYIYNRVSNIPEEVRGEVLEDEISFFNGFRTLELADEYAPKSTKQTKKPSV